MTVRDEFGDSRFRHTRRARRRLEYLFLLAGLLALDYYIWVNAGELLSQAYDHWSFAQELQGRVASLGGFLRDEMAGLLGTAPARPQVAAKPSERAAARTPQRPDQPKPLSVIGRIEIPRLHLDLMVREGVTEATLQRAVGHVPSTALPGQAGNVAFAAHRDTLFRPLRNIRKGDAIAVETLNGRYRYVVESIRIVTPKETEVLNASNRPELTLITCYPFYYVGSAPRRFIVRAAQVAETREPAALASD